VLILVSLYDRALIDTLTSGELAEEVVRTLVGSIGLVLAIPVTTAIAVAVVKAVGGRGTGAAQVPATVPAGPGGTEGAGGAPERRGGNAGPLPGAPVDPSGVRGPVRQLTPLDAGREVRPLAGDGPGAEPDAPASRRARREAESH
jgi:hypothetical protein